MKKQLTTEKKVAALTAAIERADRKLDWILEPRARTPGKKSNAARTPSEWAVTTASHVRSILRAALKKADASTCTNAVGSAPLADEGKPPNDTVHGSDRAQKGKKNHVDR